LFRQNALLVAPAGARVDLNIGTSERDLRNVMCVLPCAEILLQNQNRSL
jgi:hypothetical protein